MYQSILSQSGFSMERLGNFCSVADAGSIVGAAKGDPVRQSLISRQIRELESFFGVELIRRRGRGLELTEAGRELAAVGRENFKGLADYAARCRGAAWTARLVASNSVITWLVLPRLKSLENGAGSVRFEIHHEQTREMVVALREGIYDIAFVRKDALGPGLRHAILGEIGHSLLVPKVLLRTEPKNASAVFANVPLALPVGGKMRETVERMAEKAGVRMNVTVGCSSYLQAAQVLQSGMCAAVLPDTALSALKVAHFHRIPMPGRFTLCLAWSARNADTRPALDGLIQQMKEKMAFAV
jgi:DNA-binding transcriptional LysR family regulator